MRNSSLAAVAAIFSITSEPYAFGQSVAVPTAKAIVLGVGSPLIDAQRSGTSIAIVAGGTLYLFDAGPGVERRILEARDARRSSIRARVLDASAL